MKALEIKNLKKAYKGKPAVDGVSFSIERGEFYGFLGPNGAGKTTTIKMITGMATIDSGIITVFGIDVVADYRNARTKVGLAPQEFNVDIFCPTWKILDYMAGYYGMKKTEREKRNAELLKQFYLEKNSDKQFKELSGGMKRRGMLPRA